MGRTDVLKLLKSSFEVPGMTQVEEISAANFNGALTKVPLPLVFPDVVFADVMGPTLCKVLVFY